MDKEKTEKIVNDIFKETVTFIPTELEWFDGDPQIEHDDVWCRFLTCSLSDKELRKLLENFTVTVDSIDNDNDSFFKESKLYHYYIENLNDEEHGRMALFEVQLSEKDKKWKRETSF